MNDPAQIVHEFLTTPGTDLYNLIGAKVSEGLLPAGFVNTEKRIVFTVDVASPRSAIAHISNEVGIRCFGGTNSESDASAVGRAVFNRFMVDIKKGRGGRTATGRIVRARCLFCAPGPPEEIEGGQSWPVYLARFELITE